jgi:hypothetical protein
MAPRSKATLDTVGTSFARAFARLSSRISAESVFISSARTSVCMKTTSGVRGMFCRAIAIAALASSSFPR